MMKQIKEVYFSVEDVFNGMDATTFTASASYPNVSYEPLTSYLYYKPLYDASKHFQTNAPRVIMPTLEESVIQYFYNILKYIQLYLSDYSCFKVEVLPHEDVKITDIMPEFNDYSLHPSSYDTRFRNAINTFSERFADWVRESLDVWIPRFKIYEKFDYSEFLTNPDKVITKEDISTPRVARSRSQVRKVNDAPEEVGDFTGDGFVNQIELVNNQDNAPTGTDTFSSTVSEHDVEKELRILNECLIQVRNLYRQWMIDFRRKVLID